MENKSMLYIQRALNFDAPENAEATLVAEQTSQPPPADQARNAPPLVRPDRQLTYDGLDAYEWPDPATLHDRDTITVDRIRDDIDGPSHRFVIKRNDTVEVFFSAEKVEVGEVIGVSHANEQVCVQFAGGTHGIWFSKGQIYPAIESQPDRPHQGQPLSEIIAAVNFEHGAGLAEADRVPPPTPSFAPYTFDEFKVFHREFPSGSIAFADYREQFERLYATQDAVKAELTSRFRAKQLAGLASLMGSWAFKRSTKDENAAHIVSKMLSYFTLGSGICYQPSRETYEEAVAKKVRAVTEGEYARYFEKKQEDSLAHEKALTNPETFEEFRTFIIDKGEDALTDEQLARYDALHADITRERRKNETPSTVTKFQSEELRGIEFTLKEGFHDKRQCPLWIVQLQTRVEREAFNELNRKAKMLGGWYSSFKKADAGFQFLNKDNSDKFCSLLQEDADRRDVLEARQERKELTTAERLHELADELFSRAIATVERSNESLQNTARRADIQAGVRGQAYADQAMSRTLHSIAEALSRGEVNYLDGIRHMTHVDTLDAVLYLAKWARVRACKRQDEESTLQHDRRSDRIEHERISLATIRFAEYPYPWIHKRNVAELITKCRNRSGVKQAADKMAKRLAREKEEYVTFKAEHDIAALADFVDRAKGAGVDVDYVASGMEKYKRLNRAGITDIHELRAALREYLNHRAEARGDDPVKVAERELIGKDLPGFFPTPRSVIERMLELAEIERGQKVLEPSCGKGDILDAIKEECSDVELVAIERNYALSDILAARGHDVTFGDFLEHHDTYDRIVMNPPFENGQDIEHVRHAYSLLRPGGRLVSVMSTGPFFREDKNARAFREWLEDVNANVEWLPDDAFKGREAFRQTGVRTRLVTVTKEVHD